MEVAEQIKITDVNIDCLEKVFKYLSLKDLLSVADSTEHLRDAAKLAFASKYRRLTIVISCTNLRAKRTIETPTEVHINHTILSLQTLRCFGEHISKMVVQCVTDTLNVGAEYERLISYVSKYCAKSSTSSKSSESHASEGGKSLTEIAIHRCPTAAWDRVRTPFLDIERVYLEDATLNGHTLNRLFPKMRTLSLHNLQSLVLLDTHFPYLEEMSMSKGNYKTTQLKCDEVAAFYSIFRLNPQIRKLFMPILRHDYLQHVSNSLPLLEDLTLQMKLRQNTAISHFKSVKKFTVIGDLGTRSPVTFDELEEFGFTGSSLKGIQLYHNFLVNNSTIRKLVIESHNRSLITAEKKDIHNLVSSLPLLEELDVSPCNLTPDGAIYLMNNLKNLRKFEFFLNSNLENKRIKAQVGREWQGSRLRGDIYLFVRE